MSEISINKGENIDEIDQIILLTTCTTKLHRYHRVTLHFLDFHQKIFSRNSNHPFYYPPLLLPLREYKDNEKHSTKLHRYYRFTLHFLNFHRKKFPKIPAPLLLPPPFITFARVACLICFSNALAYYGSN